MFEKVLIIGCGLIGSSILRAIHSKKLSKKILVLEKSKKNILEKNFGKELIKIQFLVKIFRSFLKSIALLIKTRYYDFINYGYTSQPPNKQNSFKNRIY